MFEAKGGKPESVIKSQPVAEKAVGMGGLDELMQMNKAAADKVAGETGKNPKEITLQEAIPTLIEMSQDKPK